jgi:hypothetical protein
MDAAEKTANGKGINVVNRCMMDVFLVGSKKHYDQHKHARYKNSLIRDAIHRV